MNPTAKEDKMAQVSITSFFQSSFMADSNIHQTLGEEFSLCDNGNMVFHWADFHETCDAVRAHLETDPALMEDFQRREAALERLALIPVWIRTQAKVHQTTMHDLYERYILNQSHLIGVDPFGPIEISFISGTGPFKSMAIAECFNTSTYKDFVLVYLLQDKLPRRDYRIRLKSKVLMEHGNEFGKAHLIHLEQLTATGLLMSMESEFFFKEIGPESKMRILIDTKVLQEAIGKNLPDLQTYLSQYAFNLMYSSRKEDAVECSFADFNVQSSFDFFKNKKVYLFIAYDKLKANRPESVKNIHKFIEYSREHVREHYRLLGLKKSA